MGKVTFEFDSVEEQDDINMALNGYKYSIILHSLDNKLRETTKHGIYDNREATEYEIDFAIKIREDIQELLSEYKLDL
jgi:hypothetical protein